MHKHKAFTIVELLVVIIVIAVLVSLTIVGYATISSKATVASLQSDLTNNSKKLKLYYAQYASYPTALDANKCPSAPTASTDSTYCLTKSGSNAVYSYTGNSTGFTLKMNSGSIYYQVTEASAPTIGSPIGDGSYMQTITSTNCPSSLTRAVDARDNHTYWVQLLADGKCWMLTNLGYAGGGTNTYSDTDTLTNGTGGSNSDTVASYYVVPSTTNYTTEPTSPSTSTTGSGQYGYLYNWCGAMGGQATAACSGSATTPNPDPSVSVCPSGWRLPVGNGGEFAALNTAINGGSTTTDAGLRNTWFAQRGGRWNGGFYVQGTEGNYWSSTQFSTTDARILYFTNTGVNTASTGTKNFGHSVRCVAN